MADTDGNGGAPAEQQNRIAPQIGLVAQYVRDLSFENIAAQKGGAEGDGRPDIRVNVHLDANPKGEDRYEVVLKLTAKAVQGEATVFIVELDYAGIFTIKGVPETHTRPVLLIECPRILFPYARRIMSDVTRDGGYPPLMLDLIDFAAIYKGELERRRAAAAEKADAPIV